MSVSLIPSWEKVAPVWSSFSSSIGPGQGILYVFRRMEAGQKKEERAEARSSLELTGGEGQLVQGVTDGDELVVGLGADGADGHDADHGDEGEQEGVLHQRGATLVLDVQAGDQVAVDVHGVFPFREVRSP